MIRRIPLQLPVKLSSQLNQHTTPESTIGRVITHARSPMFFTAYALILNQITSAGMGILYSFIAARNFPDAIVGRNAAIISQLALISFLAQFSLQAAMVRFVPAAGRASRRFVINAYVISFISCGVCGAAALLIQRWWDPVNPILKFDLAQSIYWVLIVAVWGIFTVQEGVLIGLRKPIWVLVQYVLYNSAKIGLLFAFVQQAQRSQQAQPYSLFMAWTLAVPALVLLINWVIFKYLLPAHIEQTSQVEPPAGAQVRKFVFGDFAGVVFSETTFRFLPTLIVYRLLNDAANAYFYQSMQLALPLYMIAANMAASLTVTAAIDPGKLEEYGRRMIKQMARLLVPFALILAIFAPYILGIYGHTYAEQGSMLLRLLLLSVIPAIINVWYIGYARAQNRLLWMVLNQALLCVLVLSLSYVLLPRFGVTGVGVAWLISQSIVAVSVALRVFVGKHKPRVSAHIQN